MKRSKDRIRTMHAGSLPRPDDVREMVTSKAAGTLADEEQLDGRLTEAVADIVRQQIDCGMDSINDGELSKTNFTNYANERLGGIELRTFGPGEGLSRSRYPLGTGWLSPGTSTPRADSWWGDRGTGSSSA